MKISLGCAEPASAVGPAMTAAASTPISSRFTFMIASLVIGDGAACGILRCSLVRERPQAQLLLGDLPQPGQPVRLDDQKEYDEPAEYHQLQLLLQGDQQPEPHGLGRV